jgi:hypothetical protein
MKKNHLVVLPLLLCCNLSFGQNITPPLLPTEAPPDFAKLELAQPPTAKSSSILVSMEIASDSSFEKGVRDAKIFYSKHSKPAGATLVTTILTGPLGLIPTLACSGTPPKTHNLGLPDVALMRDPKYNEGYSQTAFGIKKQKVWKNFTYGIFISIIPTFLILNKYVLNKY